MRNRWIHHQIRDVSISNLAAKSQVRREMAYAYLKRPIPFQATEPASAEWRVPVPNLFLTGKQESRVIQSVLVLMVITCTKQIRLVQIVSDRIGLDQNGRQKYIEGVGHPVHAVNQVDGCDAVRFVSHQVTYGWMASDEFVYIFFWLIICFFYCISILVNFKNRF